MDEGNGRQLTVIESVGIDPRVPRYIVGIGASAGGLESLESMFKHMPTNSGMAFVVIQHLSPDFKSMMSELLARDTSMRIVVVEDRVRVEANTIYLIPPRKEMIIAEGCLHLSEKDVSRGFTLPIDHFLESLGRELGEASIAIILSGSGSDGTRGIAEVSRRGGLVISESLDTARFDGMPSSAQATGLVDLVLPPSEIGAVLAGYCDDPGSLPRGKLDRQERDSSLKGIDAIIQLFRSVYDIDFASYKDSTVMRRIRRRLAMAQAETFDQYAEILQSNPAELHALYGDLLIGVTQFFRDPEIFRTLCEVVLPEVIMNRKDEDGIRAWVAGCATGEEAYSIAIAFQEAMRVTGRHVPLKLFATDVHKRSIEHASRGCFNEEVLRELQPEHLERYFSARTDGYQIRPEIRQMIVFAPHNVLRDAPFTDLDFVSCRNMLIYLRPAAQRRAISLFHYGLRVGGVLLLGGSESTGELASEFDVINERQRLYRKSRDIRLTHNLRSPLTSADTLHGGALSHTLPQRPAPGAVRSRQIQDELLNRYMPPSILIDASRSVIDTFAGAEKLLRFPARQPSLDVLSLVDREIRTTLSGAIARAMKEHAAVRFGRLSVATDDGTQVFDLTVEPLSGKADEACYLIKFEPFAELMPPICVESSASEPAVRVSSPGAVEVSLFQQTDLDRSRVQILQLEDDLRYSRENLQATIEELETSNEELQATNEELIASNEELQSTNEELHSLNEELYSVNSEHQRKIEELAELNRDMNHLLENTDVATVFLDSELRIRRFTTRVRVVFELIDEDIGRSIHVFGSKLQIDDLMERLRGVLETGLPYEREVQSANGTSYLMRLLPYRLRDHISGVVMMWVDVSSLEVLRGRLRWLSAIVESTSDAIIGQDLSGMITSWNRGAELLYGYRAESMIGQDISVLVPPEQRHEISEYRASILRNETIHSIDTVRLRSDGSPIHVSLTVSPVVNSENQVIGISKIARDISRRIQMEQKIRSQVQQREHFLAMLSHELRNPLNAVSSASAVLSDRRATETARTASAAAIQRQVGIINHLLADLLDVARISENRINLKFEHLDLRELVPAVLEIVQPELDRHGCSVVFELPDECVLVNGDRTRLIQVQVNLIHNAAKYSETKAPIRVTMEILPDLIHVSVADDGRGIPSDMLESIFEPFSQLDQSRRNSDGGLGVGLTLAKSLIELHGGSIQAESSGAGQGSVFHIRLPRLIADSDAAEFVRSSGHAARSAARLVPEIEPKTICIVEDMDDSREMIRTLLELDGHQVRTAADGRTAVEILTTDPPDFALVDIGLPDFSGYEVAKQVRAKPTSKRPWLIALTGYGQPADVQEALAAGFDDHIVKPIDPHRLQQICDGQDLSGADAPHSDLSTQQGTI